MLAEPWRGAQRRFLDPPALQRVADGVNRAARCRNLADHVARAHLRIDHRFGDVVHGTEARVEVRELRDPLVARLLQEDLFQPLVYHRLFFFRRVLQLDQIRNTERLAQRSPELRLEGADRYVLPVGCSIDAIARRSTGQAHRPARWYDAGDRIRLRMHLQPRHRTVHHRDVDEPSTARDLTFAQRSKDPHGRHQSPAADVSDLHTRNDGRTIAFADDVEHAGVSQVVDVVSRAHLVRAVLAEAGERAVDQPLVLRRQHVISDAEPVHHARPERFQHHVGRSHEALHRGDALGMLQAQSDRALPPVQGEMTRGEVAGHRRHPADVVAPARLLDFDHIGAQVGQEQRAVRAGKQPRQVQDPKMLERPHRTITPR